MSDEKLYTERDLIRAKREAFEAGVERMYTSSVVPNTHQARVAFEEATASAANVYPLPKVTRPRVVKADGFRWRIVNGVREYACMEVEDWEQYEPARDRVLADLLANPTEEVEAES